MSSTSDADRVPPIVYATLRTRTPALLVVLSGVGFAAVELVHAREMSNPLGVVLEAFLPFVGALVLALLGALLWSGRYGYEPAHVPRVVAWVGVGMATMALVFLWIAAHQVIRGAPFHHAHFLAVNNLIVGGLAGFVVGTYDVRSKASERRAERERGRLQFVEHMLRHHILNGMNVVLGQADRLATGERIEDVERDEAVGLIRDHGEEIVERVEHVRTIGNSFADEADAGRTPTDLSTVTRTAVGRARERFPSATFTCDIEDGTIVRADENLSLVVENLLANAVQHNDGESQQVDVSVATESGRAVLRVADDGPGISETERAALLEWDGDSGVVGGMGVGLAIVKVLVDRYRGSIDLRAKASGGTEAVVTLHRQP